MEYGLDGPGGYLESENWINRLAYIDGRSCKPCEKKHGTIYPIDEWLMIDVKEHPNCRCYLEVMKALVAGAATCSDEEGVDVYLRWHGRLPGYYIMQKKAEELGWKSWKGNLADVAPGMMVWDKYKNRDGRLPQAEGREWYEADFDYVSGYRNKCRILYSNDGLIFVSYNHYKTFVEIK